MSFLTISKGMVLHPFSWPGTAKAWYMTYYDGFQKIRQPGGRCIASQLSESTRREKRNWKMVQIPLMEEKYDEMDELCRKAAALKR